MPAPTVHHASPTGAPTLVPPTRGPEKRSQVRTRRHINKSAGQHSAVSARDVRANAIRDDVEHLALDAVTGNIPAAVVDGVKTIIDSVAIERSSRDIFRKGSHVDRGAPRRPPQVLTAQRAAIEPNPGPPKGRRRRSGLSLPPGRAKKAVRVALRASRSRRSRSSGNSNAGGRVIAAQLGAVRAPQSLNRRRKLRFVQSSDDSITLEGHDFMATITVPTTLNPGDRILVADVHPQAIVGASRLGRISSAFETYKYDRYHATVITTADTSIQGNYLLHFDKDSGDNLIPPTGGGFPAKEQAIAHNGVVRKSFENAELAMPLHNQQKEYYVEANGSDNRLTKQARFYILCSTKPSAAYDMDVWINWRCTLRLPAIDGSAEVTGGGIRYLQQTVTTGMTAANPLGTAAPLASDTRLPPGIGMGYTVTDSYVYCKVGYKTMAEFDNTTRFVGVACTTLSDSKSSNLAAIASVSSNAGSGTANLIDSHAFRLSGGNVTLALDAAYTWDGNQWISETMPGQLQVHWWRSFHLATFTTPTAVFFQIVEASVYSAKPLVQYCTPQKEVLEQKTHVPKEPVELKRLKTVTVSDDESDWTPRPKSSKK